jgi:hypothetical protein
MPETKGHTSTLDQHTYNYSQAEKLAWHMFLKSESVTSTSRTFYSETSEIMTPLGWVKLSLIQRCPHFRVQFALKTSVQDQMSCPYFTGCPHFAGLLFTGFNVQLLLYIIYKLTGIKFWVDQRLWAYRITALSYCFQPKTISKTFTKNFTSCSLLLKLCTI